MVLEAKEKMNIYKLEDYEKEKIAAMSAHEAAKRLAKCRAALAEKFELRSQVLRLKYYDEARFHEVQIVKLKEAANAFRARLLELSHAT
jgi:hypothetical protein